MDLEDDDREYRMEADDPKPPPKAKKGNPARPDSRARDADSEPEVKPKAKKRARDRDNDEDLDEGDDTRAKPKRKKRPASESDSDAEDDEAKPRKPKPEWHDALGTCRRVFAPNIGILRVVAILCGVLAGGGLLSCLLSTVTSMMPDGTAAISLLAIPVGLIGLLWCMNFLLLSVAVHDGGIVHSHRGKSRTIFWEEIVNVWQSITEIHQNDHVDTKYEYKIELTDRTQFVFADNRFKDVEQLGKTIVEKTSTAILPQVRITYEHGERVDFGKLGFSKKGLHYGKQLLEWDEIKGVKTADGFISVSKNGKWLAWCKIAASSVPNLHVFLTFVNETVGLKAG